MSGLALRHALPKDAAAIAAIDHACNGWAEDAIEGKIRESLLHLDPTTGAVFVAHQGDALLGYGRCARKRYPDWDRLPEGCYLNGVSVLPAHRRKGLATALVHRRLAWLEERAPQVYFFTALDNHASQRLHEALGFERLAQVPVPHRGADLGQGRQMGLLYGLGLRS